MSAEYHTDSVQVSVWSESARACADLKSADRCDRADELVMCIVAEIIKKGLNPRDYFS